MLSVVWLNVVMLSVVMLSVVAPLQVLPTPSFPPRGLTQPGCWGGSLRPKCPNLKKPLGGLA